MQRRNGILVLTVGLAAIGALTVGAAPANKSAEWVDKRIQEWQPTTRERRWEEIGWAKDLQSALTLARQNNRPVFLFTHDGRLNVGRC